MKDEYERRSFPLRDIPAASNLGWEIDGKSEGPVDKDTPVPMRRRLHETGKALWGEDA